MKQQYKYHYTYIIRDKVTDCYYIGKHATNCDNIIEDPYSDRYFGSGDNMKLAINDCLKNKIPLTERFEKKILKFSSNNHENTLAEQDYTTFFNAKNSDLFYNKNFGGSKGTGLNANPSKRILLSYLGEDLVFPSRTAAANYLDTFYNHTTSSEGAIKKALKGTPVGIRSDWNGLTARYVSKDSYEALLRLYPELNKEVA